MAFWLEEWDVSRHEKVSLLSVRDPLRLFESRGERGTGAEGLLHVFESAKFTKRTRLRTSSWSRGMHDIIEAIFMREVLRRTREIVRERSSENCDRQIDFL